MTRATVSADGETIIVHIPLTFRKRGGGKLVMTPDGAEWAPRPRVANAMVKVLARAFRGGGCSTRGCTRPSTMWLRRRAWPLRTPAGGSAAHVAGPGDRGGDSRRDFTRRNCSWMICWTGFRLSGRVRHMLRLNPDSRQ
jgi:hypothetical protein